MKASSDREGSADLAESIDGLRNGVSIPSGLGGS